MENYTLPEDLMVEIMLRLPVRSLLRFKCVCKLWLSLISNPEFGQSYDELDPSLSNTDYNYGEVFRQRNSILLGFGYDESTYDYLLVLIRQSYSCEFIADKFSDAVKNSHPRIQVFSLKTNVASFIYGVDFDEYNAVFTSGLFLNQSLHWLFESKATHLPLIVAFNLRDRSLFEIPLSPDCVQLYNNKTCYLRVLGVSCLSLYYCGWGGGDADEIWVMKEYKVSSSWIKFFVLPQNISFMKNRFWPICFTKDGALVASSGDGTIMRLNDNGDVLEQHRDGLENNDFPKHRYMYRKSLLPLP
ncbi:F-box protein CPR1-like [Lotus japonicus]|uniref:F-box protein CPR1-like n=1 Tax=Lotus japonicus TaxID=34305 RepID=UPI00258BEBD9|nr:F-box protein CPR1-like [Lotus japonicus]